MEDWLVRFPDGRTFIVPAGTKTDGASIPRFLWRLCGHPLQAPRVYSSAFHDWVYGGGDGGLDISSLPDGASVPSELTRAEADDYYYRLQRHFGIGSFPAHIEWGFIRLCGGSHWSEDGHNPDDEEEDGIPI